MTLCFLRYFERFTLKYFFINLEITGGSGIGVQLSKVLSISSKIIVQNFMRTLSPTLSWPVFSNRMSLEFKFTKNWMFYQWKCKNVHDIIIHHNNNDCVLFCLKALTNTCVQTRKYYTPRYHDDRIFSVRLKKFLTCLVMRIVLGPETEWGKWISSQRKINCHRWKIITIQNTYVYERLGCE